MTHSRISTEEIHPMNPSVSTFVPSANPLPLAHHEIANASPPVARSCWQLPSFAIEELPMEDGGVALPLELCDGQDPWLAWKEWLDTGR
jgi:hypothetical protein